MFFTHRLIVIPIHIDFVNVFSVYFTKTFLPLRIYSPFVNDETRRPCRSKISDELSLESRTVCIPVASPSNWTFRILALDVDVGVNHAWKPLDVT